MIYPARVSRLGYLNTRQFPGGRKEPEGRNQALDMALPAGHQGEDARSWASIDQ